MNKTNFKVKSGGLSFLKIGILILAALLLSSCYFIKYSLTPLHRVVNTYYKRPMTLKLYDNKIFRVTAVSDLAAFPSGVLKSVVAAGEYRYSEKRLILEYSKPDDYTDTLYFVVWGNRNYLMDKIDIASTANILNLNLEYEGDFWRWDDSRNEGKSKFGLPVFPKPYDKYLIRDSIFANVAGINRDSAEVTVDRGENDGLYLGCELTDGQNNFAVEKLYPDSSILVPSILHLYTEYNKFIGNDFIVQDTLTAIRSREGSNISSKSFYIPGCKSE